VGRRIIINRWCSRRIIIYRRWWSRIITIINRWWSRRIILNRWWSRRIFAGLTTHNGAGLTFLSAGRIAFVLSIAGFSTVFFTAPIARWGITDLITVRKALATVCFADLDVTGGLLTVAIFVAVQVDAILRSRNHERANQDECSECSGDG